MAMKQMEYSFVNDTNSMELKKMKHDLLMFVTKMKSEGYLTTIDYQDLPDVFENDQNSYSAV
ncbi:hypothetical protein JSQ81_17665 [Sporosarcina sp. Marseille-Q4063]|uniref:hypothetical protein n=1 Tax=Sporosarcina sp. Marseille-Q4063 TaxID=2810514 RepID=UPI001BAF9646|nr:hypothetical protein [Sporosarcina sp. Marseille-Q4063]QUW21598.1 hypothetical protein JSQ81_17665 [Sporosarcina sp. Marseille-Q4063]